MHSSPRIRTSVAATVLALAVVAPTAAMAMPTAPQAPVEAKKSTENYKGLPSGVSKKKTLVIGLDGAAAAQINEANTPNLAALVKNGMLAKSNLYANPMAPTVSGAGWSTIATGVWPDKHKVPDNSFSNPNYAQYPDYLTRLETARAQSSTLVVGTWSPIPQKVFGEKTDLRIAGGNDAGTTAKTVDYLKNGNPDSTFVHLDEIDGAGHSSGSSSAAYAKAHTTADAQIGQILAAVDERKAKKSEDWLVVITADHGHTPGGGHGGSSTGERATFVIAQGKGIEAGSVRHDVKISDIAPTVLKHQGVRIEDEWQLDGQAVGTIKADDFDSLRPHLKTGVDETKPGPTTTGWTTTAPNGWSIDNSAMPAGGVTEWQGWSFATDEFWTNVDLNQGRETSVHNRNVFAVADSDEWDDKAHAAGQFDSTLISPSYKVRGGKTATLSFASNYRIDGPQSGEVFVSFDGGEPVLVKSYEKNFNGVESIGIEVPKKAKKAKLSFRYTGTNSAFWTVDQVSLKK
ncbi:alkaline phosphatase family protein [Paeniglutamicibacter sp. NPDC012692]|uniref:alkaline phosphatase family protein n=1 Tax=Paeniglutamicibacter sp. NPDC012692 TaxID=3364388 RepID=UPI0036AD6B40